VGSNPTAVNILYVFPYIFLAPAMFNMVPVLFFLHLCPPLHSTTTRDILGLNYSSMEINFICESTIFCPIISHSI
jgi:hypothetical protein